MSQELFESLKGRAVAAQLVSSPVFLAASAVSAQYACFSSSFFAVPGWDAAKAAWLVSLMLAAEGLGNAFLAIATWRGNSTASMSKEFVGEAERSRKWVAFSSTKDKQSTPKSVVVLAVLSSLCFNVIIPSCRLLLTCWGLSGSARTFHCAYGVSICLLLEWLVWAMTWKRPLQLCVLALLVGSSLTAGWVLYTSGAGMHTHYWGLANLLYVANMLFFPVGARRWHLEITNMPIWIMLAYGSTFAAQPQ